MDMKNFVDEKMQFLEELKETHKKGIEEIVKLEPKQLKEMMDFIDSMEIKNGATKLLYKTAADTYIKKKLNAFVEELANDLNVDEDNFGFEVCCKED